MLEKQGDLEVSTFWRWSQGVLTSGTPSLPGHYQT